MPRNYVFEAVAETLLLNVYGFDKGMGIVVDVGASIGDFVLLASRNRTAVVYAYEPNLEVFQYMRKNVDANNRSGVFLFNAGADEMTLQSITENGHREIDFLKVDCEGCEYNLLLRCPLGVLDKIRRIAMEIHSIDEHSKSDLIVHLKEAGFTVTERRGLSQGHHVYASRLL